MLCTGLVGSLLTSYQYYFNARSSYGTVRWCKYPVLPLTKKTSCQRGHRRRGQTAPLRGSAFALRAREVEAAFSFLNRYSYTGVSAMTVQF